MKTGLKKVLQIFGLLLVAGGLAYHFYALEIFGWLVPKDAGGVLLQQNVAYGPDARQKLDVYAPIEKRGALPVVLFVHGGSWQEGHKEPYAFVGRALAAQGFLTLVMNYRLFPQSHFPAFADDVDLALRWAKAQAAAYGGDPTKLFAMGHSAGAYNVAMAALDQRYVADRPALSGVITLAGPFDFLPLDSPVTIKVFGGVNDLPATQPINHVRADAPPFLILHGADDTTVFPRNARNLDKALHEKGAASTLRIYDHLGHVGIVLALAKPFRKTPVLADAVAFMRDKLK